MRFLLAVAFCLLMLGQAEASNGCPSNLVLLPNGQCQCPPGQTLRGNICVRATTTCPWGFPNCKSPTCPPGSVGTPPRCTAKCPPGQIGTPPNCTKPIPVRQCPAGTVGAPPHCKPTGN